MKGRAQRGKSTMQTHFPLGKLQFSVRSNADEPMKYVEKHTVPSFHKQLRPRRGYDGIRDCRLASKEKAGNALPRSDPGGTLGKGGAGESGPGRLGSRGESLRSNALIAEATTKQLGKRKSARPTPGLELCSSAPDSRQRTEHLRHNLRAAKLTQLYFAEIRMLAEYVLRHKASFCCVNSKGNLLNSQARALLCM